MKQLVWIKFHVNLFETAKMKLISRMRQGDAIILTWVKILALAGQINDGGRVYLTQTKPMSAKSMGILFGRTTVFMDRCLDVYEDMDLIQRDEAGFFRIMDWEDSQETEKLNHEREANRLRVARCRERKRQEEAQAAEAEQSNQATVETPQPEEPVPEEESGVAECPDEKISPYDRPKMRCPSVTYYEQNFGLLSPEAAQYLAEAESYYGEERVHRVIDIARAKGIPRIQYIKAVLDKGGGIVVESEDIDERQRRFDEEFDELLRKTAEYNRSDLVEDTHEIAS